jgi:DNA-binding transcriptional LysR family regulator
MDLVELRIFKAVAEQGGITRAAAALHRVQSNVTTRLKRLEERLGTQLFHRQGRKLVLSSEGRLLLAYADRLLRLSSEAQAALKGHAPHGVLKIGTLESTAATRLPAVLAPSLRPAPPARWSTGCCAKSSRQPSSPSLFRRAASRPGMSSPRNWC